MMTKPFVDKSLKKERTRTTRYNNTYPKGVVSFSKEGFLVAESSALRMNRCSEFLLIPKLEKLETI